MSENVLMNKKKVGPGSNAIKIQDRIILSYIMKYSHKYK